MTYQIQAIHLFNRDGRRRSLPFREGSLNFIPGGSKKGKTSLIDVIEYCFGSSDYTIKTGPYLEKVQIFCLELVSIDGQAAVLLARPAPADGSSAATRMHFSYRTSLEALTAQDVEPNSDVRTAIQRLSAALGITENMTDVGEGSRDSYRVNARHSLYFLLHPQQEIANPSLTFHGQTDRWVAQSIKDVLPYFMGAADPLFIYKRQRISRLEREIKVLSRGREDADQSIEAPNRARALLREAASVGLVTQSSFETVERVEALELLGIALDNDSPNGAESESPFGVIIELSEERDELRSSFRQIQSNIAQVKSMLRLGAQYGHEIAEQHSRLHSLSLLRIPQSGEPVASDACPLCGSRLAEEITRASEVLEQLNRVSEEVATVEDDQPGLQRLLGQFEEEKAATNARIRENDERMRDAESAQERYDSIKEEAIRRAQVRGRISLFLESNSSVAAKSAVNSRLEDMKAEVEKLRGDIDLEASRTELNSALNRVGYYATRYAAMLELEHSPSPVRLDLGNLTLVVDTASGRVPLQRIGSAESWLGYRLSLTLALCKVFSERNAAVPHFLVLDQPSQIYYQNPSPTEDDVLDDEDQQALVRIYNLLQTFIEEEEGRWQLIVTDHAEPRTDWIDDALVERWRGPDTGLVPADW